MCFTMEMSAGFALVGLFVSWWIHSRTNNAQLASGVFFFFTMEALQAVQYMFLASGLDDPYCMNIVNKVLTVLGFLHICLQPYFCHIINESLCQKPSDKIKDPIHKGKLEKYHHQYTVIKRLCLIGGFLLFLRWPLSYITGWRLQEAPNALEWIRGEHLCTFKTKAMWHLGWSIPMADSTYNIQGTGIHSFLMFAPFFALYEKKGMIIQGCVLYFSGPFLAAMISPDMMEQASIWCFFSIAQISIMLFLIRETLITHWGRGKHMSLAGKGE